MNEQTKTHIEHSREINRLQRSIDVLERSISILHHVIDSRQKIIKAHIKCNEELRDKIIKLQSQIDSL